MSEPATKDSLRRHYRRLRRDSLAAALPALQSAGCRELPALLPPGRRLGLYWPVGSEADLRPLAALLPDRLALPAIRPWSAGPAAGVKGEQRLVYLPWSPGQPLADDGCGIPAPLEGSAPLAAGALGLLLVPALAMDAEGLRLGSGGGWYDRLRSDAAWGAVPALAVLPAACVALSLPRDPWDVAFDGWLDEGGLHLVPRRRMNVASS
jgi:5-formyltetrahydrofolate cyclo-ligase